MNEQSQQEISKRVAAQWGQSSAYLGACGVSGLLHGEVSRRIAKAIDGNAEKFERAAAALQAAKVVSPLAEALEEFNELTNFDHDHGSRAAAHLVAVYEGLRDLSAALSPAAAA